MINDIKSKLKEKGYSIVTIYEPKQATVVEILDGNRMVAEFHDIDSDVILGLFHRNAVALPNLNKGQK